MSRQIRARVLLAEAASLGVSLEDLIAVAADLPQPASDVPTVAAYVDAVDEAMGGRTAETYRSYWRLLVARFGDRPLDGVTKEDCDVVVNDAVTRARLNRPGSDGRSSRSTASAL